MLEKLSYEVRQSGEVHSVHSERLWECDHHFVHTENSTRLWVQLCSHSRQTACCTQHCTAWLWSFLCLRETHVCFAGLCQQRCQADTQSGFLKKPTHTVGNRTDSLACAAASVHTWKFDAARGRASARLTRWKTMFNSCPAAWNL